MANLKTYFLFVLLLFCFGKFLKSQAKEEFWGLTTTGGISDKGLIYKTDSNGLNQEVLYKFEETTGWNPYYVELLKAPNGKYYGTASAGGANQQSVLFSWDPITNKYEKEAEFFGNSPFVGWNARGSLKMDYYGSMYGFTNGYLFRFHPGLKTLSLRHRFNSSTEGSPYQNTPLIMPDGSIYSMCWQGGANGHGTFFHMGWSQIRPTVIKHLDGINYGSRPIGGLLRTRSGKIYGLTSKGGLNGDGIILEYDPAQDSLRKVFDFNSPSTGGVPYGTLLEANNGLLYGLASEGGLHGKGVFFEFNPISRVYSVLKSFNGSTEGSAPRGNLMQASNGKLYGCATSQTFPAKDVIFEYDIQTSSFSIVYTWNNTKRGKYAYGTLVERVPGILIGTTYGGGAALKGSLFEFNIQTKELHQKVNFGGSPNGAQPRASMLKMPDETFIGQTYTGGLYDGGTVFKFDPARKKTETLLHFSCDTNGCAQGSRPILSANGKALLVTRKVDTAKFLEINHKTGAYSIVATLNPSIHGIHPRLFSRFSNGKIYGLTYERGVHGEGALYELNDTNGVVRLLKSFKDSATGMKPISAVYEYKPGVLMGMTSKGGAFDKGLIFTYNISTSVFDTVVSFNNTTGFNCVGGIIQHTNGRYYGINQLGGTGNGGVLFEYIDSSSAIVPLASTSGIIGERSNSILLEGSNGKLYGTTTYRGALWGSLFEFDPTTNTISKKFDFLGNNGKAAFIDLKKYKICSPGIKTFRISGCDSILHKGQWYYQNTELSDTLINMAANGCDSIVFTQLQINLTTLNKEPQIVACDSIRWIDYKIYRNTGIYYDTVVNHFLCRTIRELDLRILGKDRFYDTVQVCGQYMWPQTQKNYTASGVYHDTLQNQYGCDSIRSLDLTIVPNSSSRLRITSCDSFRSPSKSHLWTQTGVYYDTLNNYLGCDSSIQLILTVNQSSTSSDTITTCGSYIWPVNNKMYTNSGTHMDTIMNSLGCDSVAKVQLTVNKSSNSKDSTFSCYSFTWPLNNKTYTQSGIYLDSIANSVGCDSVLTLNLEIGKTSVYSYFDTACFSYQSPTTQAIWKRSGRYQDTIRNQKGCDSIVISNITIKTVDTLVNQVLNGLQASSSTGSYQWLECTNSLYTILPNELNRRFNATKNGSYAVEINDNNCIDTSSCNAISGLPNFIGENHFFQNLFPNPTTGKVHIDFKTESSCNILIINPLGQLVATEDIRNKSFHDFELPGPIGVYVIQIQKGNIIENYRAVKVSSK